MKFHIRVLGSQFKVKDYLMVAQQMLTGLMDNER